jgi:hypothetical protein
MQFRNPKEEDTEAILALIRTGNVQEALAGLAALPPEELVVAVKAWRSVAGRLYNDAKDLDAFVALSEALLACLSKALNDASDSERLLLLPSLCGIAYNLAAFAWAGWDEPAIHLSPYAMAAGRNATRLCLETRLDPDNAAAKFGVTPEMAWWVVGAQALAIGEFEAAEESFREAAEAARTAGESDRLERGYLALTALLAAPFNTKAATAFEAVVAEYDPTPGTEPGEHDAFFQGQLRTARRVFTGRERADGI